MKTQIIRRDVSPQIEALSHLAPLLQRIYAARGVHTEQDLQRGLSDLLPFTELSQINLACERLYYALTEQQKIILVGDFDADGATSTALAVHALRAMGAKQVDFIVPSRFTYGYGLTPGIVEVAHEQHAPDLLITVDNGIASIDGVQRAKELSIDVLVTDHHLPGETLPEACAIVNPNAPGDEFASKNLAGVGVIFYVMLALRAYLKEQDWFLDQNIPVPNMSQYLDLVALGTVADVVPLDQNNRILVHQGLARIQAGFGRPGIAALLRVAGRNPRYAITVDLGFAVGPRLNAAGRLDDMSLGVHCLLAPGYAQAQQMAFSLNELNQTRKGIETKMREEAFSLVEKLNLGDKLPLGLCLYDEDWHQGVVGLVASRVKDSTYRPVIAFAKSDDNSIKGSARSIRGIHIRDVLAAISTQHPDLISKFGGHAMAAGLSIPLENLDAFSKAFAKEIGRHVTKDQLCASVETDGELLPEQITLQTALSLREAGPWGQGFPEPVFDGCFQLVDQRVVGERHLKMLLKLPYMEHAVDAIAFNVDTEKWPNYHASTVRIVYQLDVNYFNGRQKLQLLVNQLELE